MAQANCAGLPVQEFPEDTLSTIVANFLWVWVARAASSYRSDSPLLAGNNSGNQPRKELAIPVPYVRPLGLFSLRWLCGFKGYTRDNRTERRRQNHPEAIPIQQFFSLRLTTFDPRVNPPTTFSSCRRRGVVPLWRGRSCASPGRELADADIIGLTGKRREHSREKLFNSSLFWYNM